MRRLAAAAMVLCGSYLLPGGVLGADTTVQVQSNSTVVFVVVVLLLASVAAGLFFASPLRDRVLRVPKVNARDLTARPEGSSSPPPPSDDLDPVPRVPAPSAPATAPAPTADPPPAGPTQPPFSGPWSTGAPRSAATWRNPETRPPEG